MTSGDIALAMRGCAGGQACLIHHMDYKSYVAYKHGVGEAAAEKHGRQRRLFGAADRLFGVGPLLRDSLIDMLGGDPGRVTMLVPGLAEIEPRDLPRKFTAITFGRLDPANDRIKQSGLAVASFAAASRKSCEDALMPRALREGPQLKVIGIEKPGGDEERALRQLAEREAGRVIDLLPLRYRDDRSAVFDELRGSSLSMMLSWHEGFGLTGWEAIAAEVPVIVGANSGLRRLIEELLGAPGLACLKVVDIRGHDDPDGIVNFRDEDRADVAQAILQVAGELQQCKRNARTLRTLLDEWSWQRTAETFLNAVGVEMPPEELPGGPGGDPTPAVVAAPPESSLLAVRGPAWTPGRQFSEAQLLRAEEACVPFHELRRPRADEIVGWAQAADAPRVTMRLLVGPGGAGKTRLLLEACGVLGAREWKAGFVRRDLGGVLEREAARLFAEAESAFVVVDYAETRREEVAALLRAALGNGSRARACVMLLARSAGDWWDRLSDDYADLEPFFTGPAVAPIRAVPAVPAGAHERQVLFAEARAAFASKLGLAPCAAEPPDLDAAHFGQVLFIHIAALADLQGRRPESAGGLLDHMLRREGRYWRRAIAGCPGPAPSESAFRQGVVLLTLIAGAAGMGEARRLVQRCPLLKGTGPDSMESTLRILRDFYPLQGGVDGLRPDLLGERLISQECAQDDSLLDAVLGPEVPEKQREAALTRLTRLVQHEPGAASPVRQGLAGHLAECAPAVVRVAIETGDPIGRLFADALGSAKPGRKYQVASRVVPLLPWKSLALRELACTAEAVCLDHLGKKGPPRTRNENSHLARAKGILAKRYYDLGRLEEALELAEEAVAIHRELASGRPDAFRPDLASSLSNTANHLSALGRHEQALELAEEALALRQGLSVKRPQVQALREAAAESHQQVAWTLIRLGRNDDALPHARQAVAIWVDLPGGERSRARAGDRAFGQSIRAEALLWQRDPAALEVSESALRWYDEARAVSPGGEPLLPVYGWAVAARCRAAWPGGASGRDAAREGLRLLAEDLERNPRSLPAWMDDVRVWLRQLATGPE